MLDYNIDNPSSVRNFLCPLNRLVTIIERFLPAAIEANLVFSHRVIHDSVLQLWFV